VGATKRRGEGKSWENVRDAFAICLCVWVCVCRTLSIHRRNFYCLLEVGIEQQQQRRRRRSSKQRACARCTGPQRGVGSTHTHTHPYTYTLRMCVFQLLFACVYVLVSSGLLLLSACTCTYPK